MQRICTLWLCLLLASAPASAHSGHDHGADEAPAYAEAQTPRLESAGTDMELVATPHGDSLVIYLDRAETNEPVAGAKIEVSGTGIEPAVAEEITEGTYEVAAPWLTEPGKKPLLFTIESGGNFELLNGVMEIHEPDEAANAGTQTWIAAVTSPAAWVLALMAAAFGFVAAFAFRPVRLPGSDAQPRIRNETGKRVAGLMIAAAIFAAAVPDPAAAHSDHEHEAAPAPTEPGDAPRRLPDGEVSVPKPTQRLLKVRTAVAKEEEARAGRELIGTVIADPSSFGQVQAPMDGRIELSERGISHIGQRIEAGEVLALLSPTIPVADLGTMQQLRAEVQGKLKIAEQRLARLSRIANVVAQKDIEDTRAELEALREQKRVLTPKDVQKIPLKAPVSGVISVANVRAGQVVNARDTLFEIVDPERLWVEAVGATGHATTTDIAAAHATDGDNHSIDLTYVGRAPALRQQALPMQFRVEETHEGLIIGSAVKVIVEQGPAMRGVVLPADAVVRGTSGLSQVWTKVSAERFMRQTVTTLPLDGAHVLVTAGIPENARVVVDGAELINQIR
jgi:membrane fusion protein, heavy metal efflux system